jgi:hypothetical protein
VGQATSTPRAGGEMSVHRWVETSQDPAKTPDPKLQVEAVQGWLAGVACYVKGGCGAAPAGIWGAASCRGGVLRRLPHSSAPSRRLSPKHRDDGRKTGSQRSSGSRSPSPSGGSGWGSPQQNGGSRQRSGAHGGRSGSAHSPADVRTLGFAEGFRAERGGGAIAGGGASLRHGAGLLPPSQPSATRGASGAGVASRARLLRPPGPRGLGPPHSCLAKRRPG